MKGSNLFRQGEEGVWHLGFHPKIDESEKEENEKPDA